MLEILNRYSHGLASVPILHALRERGCLARLQTAAVSAEELAHEFSANRAYLDVALRMLVCLDWIRPTAEGRYETTPGLANSDAIPDRIMDLYRFPFDRYVQGGAGEPLDPWLEQSERRWNSEDQYLPDFLDGLLIVPLLLALLAQKRLEVVEQKSEGQTAGILSLRVDPAVGGAIQRLFVAKGWLEQPAGTLQLNRAGRFVVDRIVVAAVLASYRPMFERAQDLLFGDASRVFARDSAGHETHVDRTLNVIASGFQHEKYFAALSDLVVRCFDDDAYASQPKYIVDMGCGDGSLLRRLYETVRDRTVRGKVLDAHPLIPVAVDFNEKALAEASRTLDGIEHIAVRGDIGDPLALLDTLRAKGVEDLHRVLHVRSFLDHDRPYRKPEGRKAAERLSRAGGSGIYIDAEGHAIPPGDMIQSTVEHLRRWSQVVNTHGLVMLEVHCLPPNVTARHLDESESFHFDACHALSHQYLLDAQTFLACAAEAGLFSREAVGFPKHLPFTRISLNHFERRPYVVRRAHAADLPTLAQLDEVWPQRRSRLDANNAVAASELDLVLEAEGGVVASVRCDDEETIRLASAYVRPGVPASHLRDLLQFVEHYGALTGAGRVIGLDDCRSVLQAVDDTTSVARAVARHVRARLADYPFAAEDDPRAAERELGTFSFRWLLANLQRMGVMRDAGEAHDLDELKRRLGVAPKYHRYFDALMRRLQDKGLVTMRGRRVESTPLVCDYALTSVEEQVAEFKRSFAQRHPANVGLMNFTAACLGRFDEVITGRAEINDVLFPNADMDVFASVFRGDVVSDYFNRIVADAARETVMRLKATTPKVRLLEIGAGTGGTTVGIIEALQPLAGSVEFCFTDISRSFVRDGKRRFGQHSWIEYRALNIEEDLARQGFEPQRYDIVVAANVLHDTRDIDLTLAQTRTLLKPGGLLLLNEYTSVKDCLSFSGALLHGYWLFEDPQRRLRDSCLMSVPQWNAALEHSGFAMVEAFALPTQGTTAECTQSVMLCQASATEATEPLPARSSGSRKAEIGALVEQQTLHLLGKERASAYSAHRPLMDMGLDSMELVELKALVARHLGAKLTPMFLFEHETPEKLAAALSEMLVDEQLPSGEHRRAVCETTELAARPADERDAIAVVGMACRFPGGAGSPESFWKLLESGRDGIVALPSGRWRWPSFVDVGGKHRGIDKAGFLERIDEFDAPFFRISAKEAELMDPQQRLLLELSWEAMEDSGHRPSELSGQKVGVFVGVCHSDYRELLTAAIDSAESYLGTGSAHSLLANRLSFFYDFKGPSLAVDTACSSSLVALHDAVIAIRRGDCEQALVGAVNLLCSPTISVTYYQAGMLSPTGACRTFDAKADGYVRGEGGAMLLLKPLRSALADGDAIYGLVTGTAVNHGGQAASLTAPKPEAQAAVIEAAWQAADVPLESVGYIEAHGTGTKLGDPIEIGGLIEAFRRLYRTRGEAWPTSPHCGLGSVKTVVGHLEAAAGMAGVLKILLAIQHRSIPATLNFERLNPDIDLTDSPFYVVAQNEVWPARGSHPRRAGVSSFGFGGSNSHAVIEEYPYSGDETETTGGEYLIPLSARTDEQLVEQAKRLLAFLESAPNLADVAYTLQVGREPMEERVAFIVESREELTAALQAYVAGDRTNANCYRGQAPKTRDTTLRQANGDLSALASLWVKGAEIDWTRVAAAKRPPRVHLPTYPFARQRYWVAAQSRPRESTEARLHPLLHRNTSDLREQRFSSTFTGDEFFLAGHRIGGRRLLPGVAYLEMAREAVARAAGGITALKNVLWLRPLVVAQEPLEVHIALFPKQENEVGFEIYADDVVHARGVAVAGASGEPPRRDVTALAERLGRNSYAAEACYAAFAAVGMEYGDEHRAIEALNVEGEEVVARLSSSVEGSNGFMLYPGLLDSALQATVGFTLASGADGAGPSVPFELRSAKTYGACTGKSWALVRRVAPDCYDIDVCDDEGSVSVRLSGLTMRPVEGGREKPAEVRAEVMVEAQELSASSDDLHRRLQDALVQMVSRLVKVRAEDVEPSSEFGSLGFDSIAYIELVDQLTENYGAEVEPTVFFQHRTLEKFSRYLLQTHREALAKHLGRPSVATTPPSVPKERPAEKRQRPGTRFTSATREGAAAVAPTEPIAIIGMSGRFPMAQDVDELWENLRNGRDCISEIPPERWDWRAVSDDSEQTPIKWGGFIDGVDEFDPLFFNISPHEAELMDPQQRLLMMYVWKAIEDAGYSTSRLAGSKTGIFFGTGISDYTRVIARSTGAVGAFMSTGTVASVGPNRMSYYLDLHGPSEPIETACSSSLVAIHRAVWAMRTGQCEMAIAGGVNTILTPDLHISFAKAGMLSGDGRCKTFSAGADGYVRSEGVGALLLKKLSAAEEAGDHIYAVIVGSAENHGGRASSLTAPNPQAQAELLEQAYREAGVDPRSVGYIEAHGTGTALGDPIEIEGLKAAFEKLYAGRGVEPVAGQCGLGSVKSNIGHLEVAAGVAGVIKVLLQMQHQTLVPSLHCETINPYIHFEGSPFYIVRERAEWSRRQGETGEELPRRAGVSSFGFGGANAHVVLEEYVAKRRDASSPARAAAAVLLSARTPERLREQADQLLAALRKGRFAEGDLADIAYTLQVGREHMEERLGLLVSSLGQLQQKLQAFLDGVNDPGLYHGQARKVEKVLTVLTPDEAFQGAIEKWFGQGRFEMLLELWVKGVELDWSRLYSEAKPRRISLPTYPFARERYWIETAAAGGRIAAEGAAVLHPLLHSNTSDLSEQRYSSTFTGEEFFLADHQVGANGQAGQKVLPGVAYLEMVRAAIEHASPARPESTLLELRNAVWAQPIVVTDRTKVDIALSADDDQIEYRIYSQSIDDEIVHCHGRAVFSRQPAPAKLDLEQIESQMGQGRIEPNSLYAACARMGLTYGPTFQGITAIRRGNGQLLARLRLPAAVASTSRDYVLHPSLMDSALQASVGLFDESSDQLRVPFALESLLIVSPCTAEMVAWVRRSPDNHNAVQLDIDLCDACGNVCAQMHGLSLRVMGDELRTRRQAAGMQPTVSVLPQPETEHQSAAIAEITSDDLSQKTLSYLLHEFSGILKLPAQKIDPQASFETYGVDSIAAMELTDQLEEIFGALPATLFFEHQTLRDLTGYFVQSHTTRLAVLFRKALPAVPQAAVPAASASAATRPSSASAPHGKVVAESRSATPSAGRRAKRARNAAAGRVEPDAIAIIGLSGRYPEAIDIDAYWRNLRDGKDCIIEVPKERWDWREYFSEDRTTEGRHYSKWGGFIAGVDEFDPLFFNISPKEAEQIDPQERLFLQHAWMAIEDAGYTRARLQMPADGDLAGQVGVYAGVWTSEYQLFGAQASMQGDRRAFAISVASIANRVSYALNLHGPSMTLDTMCSSSLTAIHLACQDLKQRRTSMAIAGAVNVTVHPNKYLMLSGGQFISSDGHCQSFGEGGDGYIPGEGVGVVVLKRLSEAERDGDHIYGIIRGSALNHGGKTNGYTVPSPQAQAAVIGRALVESNIDARHVSYVEAHGTGTKLGDPIELTALTKAFHAYTQETGYCLIGSAKSNIGHCESAAGIAGLTKVLLQMQHQEIVPSLHSAQLNPHIDFDSTPFVVNQTLKPWEQPVIDGQNVPRIAGISSFGAGGSNAHLIVEEYPARVQQPMAFTSLAIPLSARTAEQLQQKVHHLLDFVRARRSTIDLVAVAYTLQVGREAMDERLGFVVSSVEQLIEKLEAHVPGKWDIEDAYRGQARRNKDAVSVFAIDADLQQTVAKWIANKKHSRLLDLWVKGLEVDWSKLYGEAKPGRISLPTYPFAKERHWVDVAAGAPLATTVLHPLLQRNTSVLSEQRYSSTFTGNECFLTDHEINANGRTGQKVLPSVAYLEMARAAIEQACPAESMVVELRDVVWAHPFVVSGNKQISITLLMNDSEEIDYEIYSHDAGQKIVHCEGRAVWSPQPAPDRLDLERLKAQMGHGAELRSINESRDQLLAHLQLPSNVEHTSGDYVLHPTLMEGALQASVWLIDGASGQSSEPRLPVALDSLRIVSPCTREMVDWVRYSPGGQTVGEGIKLDIDLCDAQGNVCAQMRGLSTAALGEEIRTTATPVQTIGTLLATPVWQATDDEPTADTSELEFGEHHVILCELAKVDPEKLESLLVHSHSLSLQARPQANIAQRYGEHALACFERIQTILRGRPRGKVLMQIAIAGDQEQAVLAGLSGLLRTAALENPRIVGQVMLVPASTTAEELYQHLKDEKSRGLGGLVRHEQGVRQVLRWQEIPADWEVSPAAFKDNGVYLITGGLGGLGIVFTREILEQTREARVILTGRAALSVEKQARLDGLSAHGGRVGYRQVDLNDLDQVRQLVAFIQNEYGQLDGILHSAGMIADNLILKKTGAELIEVLSPKVTGTFNLDEASQDVELDFFVLFSSIAGATGTPSGADYAAANGFMDQFAAYRNRQLAAKRRHGRTRSINWPLWRAGGMTLEPQREQLLQERTGMQPMQTATGLLAFYRSLACPDDQLLVAEGDIAKITSYLQRAGILAPRFGREEELHSEATWRTLPSNETQVVVGLEQLRQEVTHLLGTVLCIEPSLIDVDQPFSEFGLDSVRGVELMTAINKRYDTELSNIKVFDYPTVRELSSLLEQEIRTLEDHSIRLRGAPAARPVVRGPAVPVAGSDRSPRKKGRVARTITRNHAPSSADRIAIVGMSGRYPKANDLKEYWDNLAEGRNCIVEVPPSRWDANRYYHPDPARTDKTNSKWLGALDDIDRFDPLFFRISPQEAEQMDPQHRLFLQESYKAFEDAGYDTKTLNSKKCGVYLGIQTYEYASLLMRHGVSVMPVTSNCFAIAAARIAYYLNLKGPAIAVNTACSSSLVAVHLACQSLWSGETDMALAGGVSLWLTPESYLAMSQAGMLSSVGQCKAFDAAADGFVPGEGVGVLVLKRLHDAQQDNDFIYGVILGSGINQDGRTNGITAPSVNSQIELERAIYAKYQIDPDTISYVETHGTGTKLGDPIELEALATVFKEKTARKNYCALGAVKSNIGHTTAAAGVAGLQKVLLSLQHRTLVPTLNVSRENAHFDFANSPFYISREKAPWHVAPGSLRRAAVSSFGFSGTNAHLVIEEYQDPIAQVVPSREQMPFIVPLSARTAEQLRQRSQDLLVYIRTAQRPVDLAAVAYTLQIGREAMDERVGFVVRSVDELTSKLGAYVNGEVAIGDFHRGQVKRSGDGLSILSEDDDLRDTAAAKWIAEKRFSKLLGLWVKGLELDWRILYGEVQPQRIPLPTYPFAKERYWVDRAPDASVAAGGEAVAAHPLLQRNTSDLDGQRYTSAFTGQEFFLTDHQVRTNGSAPQKVLPGAAYLEMARAAMEQAWPGRQKAGVLELRNTVWLKPVVVTEHKQVSIALSVNDDEQVDFEIYGLEGEQETIHCQGQAVFRSHFAPAKLDLERLQGRMDRGRLDAADLYAIFEQMGIHYGPAHQGISSIDIGEKQLLAQLRLPAIIEAGRHEYVLHPSLVDSALQASVGLLIGENRILYKPRMPFLMELLRVVSACTPKMAAWIRYSEGTSGSEVGKVDIDVCDRQGNVCIQMRGFATRAIESKDDSTATKLHIKKQEFSFDESFYENIVADIANHELTVDEALRLG